MSKAAKITNNYAIKQVVLEGRCVKKLTLHNSTGNNNSQFIVLATFKHIRPHQGTNQGGFNFPESQKGSSVQYDIEVYRMPQPGDKSQQYIQYFEMPPSGLKQHLRQDEMVVCMENVRLKVADGTLKVTIIFHTLITK